MGDFGQLVPNGGGDPIPLNKDRLLIGRRESCDIVLRFPNVSGQHARMSLEQGYWFLKDLGSRNGTKVEGFRVDRKRLDPGVKISFAIFTSSSTRLSRWEPLGPRRQTTIKLNSCSSAA
jgi:adenylate cyclase